MSNDARLASGGGVRSKRRLTDIDEESRPTPVADESTSNPKRQRVSRACDSCRSKKDKCDGVRPVCSTCASLSRPCTYKANPKKRGLPTGYIRTLELLWALVFTKIQGSEDVVRTLLRTANIPSHLATMGKEAEGSDTLLSSWKNSFVLKDIERLLTFLEQPEDEQQERGGRSLGEIESPLDAEGSSVLSTDTLEWHLPDALGEGREGSLAIGLSPVKTPTTVTTIRQTPNRITRDSGTQTAPLRANLLNDQTSSQHQTDLSTSAITQSYHPQVPSNPWPLLDIYFSYTQCWFPIIEKHDILRTAFRHAQDDAHISASSPGSGDHAALWAVLTLASIQQASISTTRQQREFPGDQPDPTQLYARARSLIPGEHGAHEIGHVQALLILSLVKIGQQDREAAWILVGQAVRIAQSLGLNHSSSTPATPAERGKTAGRTKHVFLGCFILETLVAVQTDQVPSLRKADLTNIGPVDEDGLEEWHPWEDQTSLRPIESARGTFHRGPLHALSTFNRLLTLMCILNDLSCWSHNGTNSISHLEALERQLQLWVSALPRSYRVDLQTNASRPAPPHVFALDMMYEGVSTAISLPLSIQRGDRGTQTRTSDSSKRLISLLQMYMETYSLSATCPTFGLILTFGFPSSNSKRNAAWSLEVDPGLKSKLQSFSSHLATVWSTTDHSIPESRLEPVTMTLSVTTPQRNSYGRSSATPIPVNSSSSRTMGMGYVDETRPTTLSVPDPYLSAPWIRVPPTVEDSVPLSLPTPAPSLNINPASEPPHSISQPKEPSYHHHHHRPAVSGRPPNGAGLMSDLTTPLPAPGSQYQRPYHDPNMHLNSLVDIDGYGSLHRPRIAPDLDALFDELASLDGTDRMDNQPEFMQNLGFVPEAGIPELYPYTSQTDSYLLAPSQPSLTSPEATLVRRESQPTGEHVLDPKR